MRRLFKRHRFEYRSQQGQLSKVLKKAPHLSAEDAAKAEKPYCTHSEMWKYVDPQTGATLAVAHQYRLPDDSVFGKGADPKRLEISGDVFLPWLPPVTVTKRAYYWAIGWIVGIRYKLFGLEYF